MVDYNVKDEELENQTIDENGNNNELDNVNEETNDIDKVEDVDENIGDENKEEIIGNNKERKNIDLGLNDKLGYNIWDTIVKGV